jgi:mannose-binding lectin 1
MHIRQMPEGFSVYVDSKVCFESNKIQLPSGYYVGVSAQSADNPDSFEVHSFITSSPETKDFKDNPRQAGQPDQQQQQQQQQQPLGSSNNVASPNGQAASSGTTSGISSEQFSDLQNRVTALDQQMEKVLTELGRFRQMQDQRHEEIMSRLRSAIDGINGVDRTTNMINQNALAIKREVENRDYQQHLSSISDAMQETKSAISAHLPQTIKTIVKGAVPSLGVFVFIVLGFQGLLAASYFWYKHRRNTMPKKFL